MRYRVKLQEEFKELTANDFLAQKEKYEAGQKASDKAHNDRVMKEAISFMLPGLCIVFGALATKPPERQSGGLQAQTTL